MTSVTRFTIELEDFTVRNDETFHEAADRKVAEELGLGDKATVYAEDVIFHNDRGYIELVGEHPKEKTYEIEGKIVVR